MFNKRSFVVISLSLLLLGAIPMIAGQEERPEREAAEITWDIDEDGYVSYREFYSVVSQRLEDKTADRVFKAADLDDDGQLSERELRKALEIIRSMHQGDDETDTMRERRARRERLRRMREDQPLRPDADGNGAISLREFHRLIDGRLDDDTIHRIFNAADADEDGELNRREMYKAWEILKSMRKDGCEDKDGGSCCQRLKERPGLIDITPEKVQMIFRLILGVDANDDGEITLMEIIQTIMKIGRVLRA